MSITKTLGGERIGSGNKMKQTLHGYGRSTHDLSKKVTTSMAIGTLVPIYYQPIRNGDDFFIEIDAGVISVPLFRQLMGSLKIQVEAFTADDRLYIRALHNNKLGVGLHIEEVLYPMLINQGINPDVGNAYPNQTQINTSSLSAYLGLRGLGVVDDKTNKIIKRKVRAIPTLMYWDYIKTHHIFKQEENAYYIGASTEQTAAEQQPQIQATESTTLGGTRNESPSLANDNTSVWTIGGVLQGQGPSNANYYYRIYGTGLVGGTAGLGTPPESMLFAITRAADVYPSQLTVDNHTYFVGTWEEMVTAGWIDSNADVTGNAYIEFRLNAQKITDELPIGFNGAVIVEVPAESATPFMVNPVIKSFPISNLDDMREALLGAPTDEEVLIGAGQGIFDIEPYNYASTPINPTADADSVEARGTHLLAPMGGLALKTYLSDRFNNWVNTETIEGANGIAQITAVSTADGGFTIDALNLAQKVYNMLNRIAVAGGTYEDWQEAVYGDAIRYRHETPHYVGGISGKITFEQITNTAETEERELADLASIGIGSANGKKIHVKGTEPSNLMILASLTPLNLMYSQGNKWWNRIKTMDDWHKPELDQIGFQDLLTEEMTAWDTHGTLDEDGFFIPQYRAIGKQPAYIEYMTDVDEAFGTFANRNQDMNMTFNRRYTPGTDLHGNDYTVYIDPTKFNYAFRTVGLESQNFWATFNIKITARRKMSAKQIPNM